MLASVHPETPDKTLLVSNLERRDFSSWLGNRGVARRRTTYRYAALASSKIDNARAEKSPFRMETS